MKKDLMTSQQLGEQQVEKLLSAVKESLKLHYCVTTLMFSD